MKPAVPILFLAMALPAQDKPYANAIGPSATRIGKHHLGETFQEWLAADDVDSPEAACESQQQQTQRNFRKDADSTLAEAEANVSEGMRSEIKEISRRVTEDEVQRTGKECAQQMRAVASGTGEIIVEGSYQDKNGRNYNWRFAGRKLERVSIRIPSYILSVLEPDTQQEIDFLTQAFGAPTQTKTVSYQNSYGAKWNCPEVTWAMPDGALIVLGEHIRTTDSGPRRGIEIDFISQEALKVLKGEEKPNPYK